MDTSAPSLEPTGDFLRRRGLAYRSVRILAAGPGLEPVTESGVGKTFHLDVLTDENAAAALLQREQQAVIVARVGSEPEGTALLERLGELAPSAVKVAYAEASSPEALFPFVQRGVIDLLIPSSASAAELELALTSAVERATRERASAGLLEDLRTDHAELNRKLESTTRELKTTTERLERMSVADSETGLYGMSYFSHTWRREMARSTRYGRPLALMVLDLDERSTADSACLRAAGTFLLESIRDVDFVGRFRDEGFAVILPECGKADGLDLAERLRLAFEEQAKSGPLAGQTLSIALVACPEDESSAGAMTGLADRCLREGMARGRNQVLSGS